MRNIILQYAKQKAISAVIFAEWHCWKCKKRTDKPMCNVTYSDKCNNCGADRQPF